MINNAPMVRLGDYIEECDERNSDNALTLDALKGNNPPSTPGDGNIPEPTTASLSLLALAGLAARRRRR